jgi:hypothetical protein
MPEPVKTDLGCDLAEGRAFFLGLREGFAARLARGLSVGLVTLLGGADGSAQRLLRVDRQRRSLFGTGK